MKTPLFFALTLMAGSAHAATVSVSSYSYTTDGTTVSPTASYADSGNELTDGTVQTTVWPSTAIIGPLVGWNGTDPAITFNFSSPETVRKVTVWSADSNGSAGVRLPDTITVRTPDNSFSQTFSITDPAGSGSVASLELTGFETTTNALVIEPRRADNAVNDEWIMLTEVSFDTVPEPSSALLLGIASLGLLRRRR